MASSYPSTFDNLVNPTASDKTNSATVPHATQHANLNDIAEALQHKVGLSTAGVGGSSYPSTKVGDSLAVNSSGGQTAWGTFHPVKIAETITTSTATAAVDVTIPEHFGGLLIQAAARSESTALIDTLTLQFGSTGAAIDTSSNYDYQLFQVTGTTVVGVPVGTTGYMAIGVLPGSTGSANNFGSAAVTVPNYYSTQARKRMTSNYGAWDAATSSAAFRSSVVSGVWNSTAPVGKLRIGTLSGAGFSVGSAMRVYGMP